MGPAARWASITPIAATGDAPEAGPEEPREELSGRFALGGIYVLGDGADGVALAAIKGLNEKVEVRSQNSGDGS